MEDRHRPPEAARGAARPRWAAHLWVPACLSGLLLLAFFPLILRLQPGSYQDATGRSPSAYLVRWLALSAALFLASALLYAGRAVRRRRRRRRLSAGDQPSDRRSG